MRDYLISQQQATLQTKIFLKEGFCIQFFRPRTHPRTFLQCFALDSRCSKAKHCRNVLGRVLGQKIERRTDFVSSLLSQDASKDISAMFCFRFPFFYSKILQKYLRTHPRTKKQRQNPSFSDKTVVEMMHFYLAFARQKKMRVVTAS